MDVDLDLLREVELNEKKLEILNKYMKVSFYPMPKELQVLNK